jgi:hypothetical protein
MTTRRRPRAVKTAPTHWPAAAIEMRSAASLIPYARNARVHSPEQVDQIAASMREFGFTMPILIDEGGEIIAGHGRLMAAQKIGMEDVPCMMAKGWSEEKRRAYVIADNRLAENATWDESLLKLEFGGLRDAGFDVALTGFSAKAVDAMFAPTDGIEDAPATNYKQQYGVIVICKDEKEQQKEFEALTKAGKKVKIVVT